MTTHEKVLWFVVVVLCVRSVLQQIYIVRLKSAMVNLTEALGRAIGYKVGDPLRGDKGSIEP